MISKEQLFDPFTFTDPLFPLQLIDADAEGFVSLLTDDGSTKDDLSLPAGTLGEEIRAAFDEYVSLF